MSENILIALITAIGAMVGGITGAAINAYATIKVAEKKSEQTSLQIPTQVKEQKVHWLWGMIGGAVIGAGMVLGVLIFINPFEQPAFPSGSTNSIVGDWVGATTWNDIELETKLSIRQDCVVGEVCGTTRSDGGYYCAGNLVLSKIEGDTFIFVEQGEYGNVPEGCLDGALQYLRLLSPGKLSWSVTRNTGSNPGSGSGVLIRQ
jgi:hypothetical protein